MKQILFQWGPFAVPSYGLFVGIAIVVGLRLSSREAGQKGLSENVVLDTCIVSIVVALFSARFLFAVFARGETAFGSAAGRSVYAAVFAGTLVGIAFLRARKLPVLQCLDVIFLYVPLCQAIGRLGCFLYGCCYGTRCDAHYVFAARFRAMRDVRGTIIGTPAYIEHLSRGWITRKADYSLPVHPTQLYEALLCICLFFLLRSLDRRKKRRGEIIAFYGILYGVIRFYLEFLRGDNRPVLGILTPAQMISIACLIAGLSIVFARSFQRRMLRKRADAP